MPDSVVYIPCLNVDAPDGGVEFSAGVVPRGGGEGGIVPVPGVTISSPDWPVTFTISPIGPSIFIGINFKWWADLFGLGETRIEREKEEIQDVLTPIFRYLRDAYGFPLRDGHALQFSSDRVRQYMRERPDLDFIRPSMYDAAYPLAQSVFVDQTPSRGQRERIVNQFLANAADNKWPLNATIYVWNAMLRAADRNCRNDSGRWMRNPIVMEKMAHYAALLRYMPLANFASAISERKFNDKMGRRIMTVWFNNPQLVAGIPQVLEIPPWAVSYKSAEDGGGQSGNPYETQQIADRQPIQDLWARVKWQRPVYPDLIVTLKDGVLDPQVEIPPAQKPPDWGTQDPVPPWPGDNVVEIPPQPPGPVNWPQYPDCPPWNQRPQPGDPDPNPQPDPDEPPQQDGKCDPDCQWQIDYLLERVQYIDNWLALGIVPRLDNLEDWVRDLERRVPGPLPPLPNPTPFPPWLPPEEIPTDPGDEPTEPTGEESPCEFTEEDCEELEKWIDPDKRCEEIKKCDRELACVDLTLCDETGGPWGGMAECWLDKNTPLAGDIEGVYAGRQYPQYAVQAVSFCYENTLARLGFGGRQGQGQGTGISLQSEQGMAARYVDIYAPMVTAMFDGGAYEPVGAEDIPIQVPPFIYEDPTATEEPKARIITVKPRPGEIDPCTGIAEEVVEIPPVTEQPPL